MGKKSDYILLLERELVKATKEAAELEQERDFLADQVNKLESVIDQKQATIDEFVSVSGLATPYVQ